MRPGNRNTSKTSGIVVKRNFNYPYTYWKKNTVKQHIQHENKFVSGMRKLGTAEGQLD